MIDRYLGIVLVSVVLWYLFKDANGTRQIIKALSDFNVSAVSALQGRGAGVALN